MFPYPGLCYVVKKQTCCRIILSMGKYRAHRIWKLISTYSPTLMAFQPVMWLSENYLWQGYILQSLTDILISNRLRSCDSGIYKPQTIAHIIKVLQVYAISGLLPDMSGLTLPLVLILQVSVIKHLHIKQYSLLCNGK